MSADRPDPKKRRHRKKRGGKRQLTGPKCSLCGRAMTLAGGYQGTGLCGPCSTGDAGTLGEIGRTW